MKHGSTTKSTAVALTGILMFAVIAVWDVSEMSVTTASAQQNVTIAPTRVVFEERDRTQELVLFNQGSETVTYRISLVGMKMTGDGSLERLEQPEDGHLFAHDLLRFAPRQVQLEPGESQRVRMSVRKPEDLEDGEYRSHVMFQGVPNTDDEDEFEASDEELALRLNIITGLSIPAIVRHGELSVDVDMEDVELVEGDPDAGVGDRVSMRLLREGDRSVYGDLRVEFIPDDAEQGGEAEPVVIGRRGGTALYTPNEYRDISLGLTIPDEISLDDGRILVTYEEDETGETLTSKEVELN